MDAASTPVGADAGQRALRARAGALWRRARHPDRGRRDLALAWRDDRRAAAEELVEARLEVFGPATLRALEVVAAGAPLEIGLLEPRRDGRAGDARAPGDRPARVDGRRRSVDVAHPLHGEAIRAGLSGMRQEAIQRRLADTVESRGGRRRTDVARLAAWRLESGGEIQSCSSVRRAGAGGFRLRAGRTLRARGGASGAVAARGSRLGRRSRGWSRGRGGPVAGRLGAARERDGERAAVAIARARNLFWGADRASDADACCDALSRPFRLPACGTSCARSRVRLGGRAGRGRSGTGGGGPLLRSDGVNESARLDAVVAMSEALLSRGRMREALALVDTWEPVARRHRRQLPRRAATAGRAGGRAAPCRSSDRGDRSGAADVRARARAAVGA